MAVTMRFVSLAAVAILAACAGPPQASAPEQVPVELAGRTAGAPQHCVPMVRTDAFRVSQSNRHVLLYGTGRTIWANRVDDGCEFNPNDVLVTQPFSGSYCRGDIVHSFDPSRFPGPSCRLGDFVPYTR